MTPIPLLYSFLWSIKPNSSSAATTGAWRQEGEVSQHLFPAGHTTQSQLQADVRMCHDLVIL